jgi:hypothetical protein
MRRLHYTTARHSDGQYKVNNFNPLSDIMRCFDSVWQLNLIAITIGFVAVCVNGNMNQVLKHSGFVMNPKTFALV